MDSYFKPRAGAKRTAPVVVKAAKKVGFNYNTKFVERKSPILSYNGKTDKRLENENVAAVKIQSAYRVGNLGWKPFRAYHSVVDDDPRPSFERIGPKVPYKSAYKFPKVDRKYYVKKMKSKRFLDDMKRLDPDLN